MKVHLYMGLGVSISFHRCLPSYECPTLSECHNCMDGQPAINAHPYVDSIFTRIFSCRYHFCMNAHFAYMSIFSRMPNLAWISMLRRCPYLSWCPALHRCPSFHGFPFLFMCPALHKCTSFYGYHLNIKVHFYSPLVDIHFASMPNFTCMSSLTWMTVYIDINLVCVLIFLWIPSWYTSLLAWKRCYQIVPERKSLPQYLASDF